MQSSLRPPAPSFIGEIERDLRATTMAADHIIFMGYSLPPEDVTYRAFFSARRQRRGAYCTVVDKDDDNPGWYDPTELEARMDRFKVLSPVRAACDIFGPKKVRFYGGGIPEVFLDGGEASEAKVDHLLTWSA